LGGSLSYLDVVENFTEIYKFGVDFFFFSKEMSKFLKKYKNKQVVRE